MVFVTILLNLLNSKHLLKIEQILLPEKMCTSQLQLRTKRNPIQKKQQQPRHESGCNAEISAGRQLSKSHKEYLMTKSKSAANFVGKEKDPKLSGFDLSTSTAGNLDAAFLALSNLCLWFLHLQPNLKGHSVWWIESLKLQQLLDKSFKVALAQYKFDAEEVLVHRIHLSEKGSQALILGDVKIHSILAVRKIYQKNVKRLQ